MLKLFQYAPCGDVAEGEGFAPLAARPGEQPTGLFSLRPSLLFPYSSCANRSLYFGLCPRASRLRDASASGHPLIAADARTSTLESLSSFGKRERGSRLFACSPVPVGGELSPLYEL